MFTLNNALSYCNVGLKLQVKYELGNRLHD